MTTPASAASSRPSSTVSDASSATMPADKAPDEGSKLRTFISILRKFLGVADLAAVRFSLPAQLLEPRPNLEYWMYLDRPEAFTCIGDSDDELGRMLAALRFWYTKDLKYVKGKPCKPYNSVLGEFFRCTWDVEDTLPVVIDKDGKKHEPTETKSDGKKVQVSYLTEQTSHHPPVSAWVAECPEKGISARGIDQLSGKFTGTSIKVIPGSYNLGIFVRLDNRDGEEYQMTHPAAFLGGILRGNLSVTVADHCFVACPKTRLKTILHYVEEGWLGKTQNKMLGAVYRYDPENDNITELKKVPEKDVLVRLEGNWTDKIYYTMAGEKDKKLLLDLNPLSVASKNLPPEDSWLPNESMRFWAGITTAIKGKQFGEANRLKQELEERQRTKAKEREESKTQWTPRFFTTAMAANGKPDLTDEGRKTMLGLHNHEYAMAENTMLGA